MYAETEAEVLNRFCCVLTFYYRIKYLRKVQLLINNNTSSNILYAEL